VSVVAAERIGNIAAQEFQDFFPYGVTAIFDRRNEYGDSSGNGVEFISGRPWRPSRLAFRFVIISIHSNLVRDRAVTVREFVNACVSAPSLGSRSAAEFASPYRGRPGLSSTERRRLQENAT